jgi:hypothetical protein
MSADAEIMRRLVLGWCRDLMSCHGDQGAPSTEVILCVNGVERSLEYWLRSLGGLVLDSARIRQAAEMLERDARETGAF